MTAKNLVSRTWKKTVRMRTVFSRKRGFPRFFAIAKNLRHIADFLRFPAKIRRIFAIFSPRRTVRFFREELRKICFADFFARISRKPRNSHKKCEKRAHTLGRNLVNFGQISTFLTLHPSRQFVPRRARARIPQIPPVPRNVLGSGRGGGRSRPTRGCAPEAINCFTAPRLRKSPTLNS